MRTSRLACSFALVALALASACPGGDDSGGDAGTSAATVVATAGDTSTAGSSDSDAMPTTDGGSTSGTPMTDDGMMTTSGAESTSEEGFFDETGPACDPVVVGEWNACAPMGNVDNTLCNWMGDPDGVGFVGCLNSSDMDGHNVCMISGCEDACDCFAPPATGNAIVECADILEGGGTACVLTCAGGETCPDGMECAGAICFHPPEG